MRAEVKHFLTEYVNRFQVLNIEIDSLVLFGSQARGTATISSDIDIAVVTDNNFHTRSRGILMSLGEEIDTRFAVNLFFTTKNALENASDHFDTNKHIREEGLVLWQS